MSRLTLAGASGLGLALLIGALFGPAIAGRQFAYRDAAHYYYPLYQRVEAEWDAGRWPTWSAEENAGVPLLGNPTAAVLYPGKLIYRLLPYPLAARVYVIAHTLLAFAGMVGLARSLGVGGAGSAVAGIAYAFAAPVVFQYCNVIFLVGAAWVPWGLRAVDGWLRLGRRGSIAGLAVVLAMQVLGGDPQSAYIVGLCAGGYAVLLGRAEAGRSPGSTGRKVAIGLGIVVVLVAWVAVTIYLGGYLPTIRPKRLTPPTPTFPWNRFIPPTVAAIWGLAFLVFLGRWIKGRPGTSALGRRLVGLGAAAGLAGMLAGAQLLPVLEFTGMTGRAADEGTHDIYPFSLEPYRVAELALPNLFGTLDRGNRSWLPLIPPVGDHKIWVPSLYMGGAILVMALVGLGGRYGPAWRGWVAAIAAISLVASMGEFLSPIWVARFFGPMAESLGPHDPYATNAIRQDGFLRDGDGSFYHLLATVIPGFGQFRYPSKLLTFTVAALAILAGHGWDLVASGPGRRRALGLAVPILLLTVGGAVAVRANRDAIVAAVGRQGGGSLFGPIQPVGVFEDIRAATDHGALAIGLAIVATILARRRPALASALILVGTAADLATANAGLIITAEQSAFEATPRALAIIAEAEAANPSVGPYRVHRQAIWSPEVWRRVGSPGRVVDFLRWERDTLQPKYGVPLGVEYTHTQGVAELYDYEWFFGPFEPEIKPDLARQLGIDGPKPTMVYYPRRGFDLWNTRYLILPGYPVWTDSERGIASLVNETERIYPRPGAFDGPDGRKREEQWLRTEDFQVVRNKTAFPRAWVVHDARFLTPVEGLGREIRKGPMEEMLYEADPFWNSPGRIRHEPRELAWIETDQGDNLARFRTKGQTGPGESVTVRRPSPVRTELEVTLDRPGLVILADVYYPGWTLTIDGHPAPILRANRLMRGAAIEAGPHTLVYEYRPRSFEVGKALSLAGMVALLGVAAWASRGRRDPGPVTADTA